MSKEALLGQTVEMNLDMNKDFFNAIREGNTPEICFTGNFNFSVIETENH